MSDLPTVTLRVGEIAPIFGQIVASGGLLQITGMPTFTLYTSGGIPVTGMMGISVSGYDPDPTPAPRAWYDLDTTNLPPGGYQGILTFAVDAGDGLARTERVSIPISVQPAVPLGATYDITTPLGQTRFHCADTNPLSAVWSDAELQFCLTIAGGNPRFAAATALEAAATDAAKVAIVSRNGSQSDDPTKIPELLMAQAARLRQGAGMLPDVGLLTAGFTFASPPGFYPGTTLRRPFGT